MGEETFAKTLEIQLFNTHNLYTATKRIKKPKFIKIAKDTIYVFQTHGAFLDNVPIEDRKKFNNEIMKWICSVYDDSSRIEQNKIIHARASDKKASDITAINHVIEIINALSSGLEAAVITSQLLHELRDAIKNDEKKEVLHDRYYRMPLTNKKPIENIIKEMIKRYGITKAKTATKTLIESLPTHKNMI